MDLIYSLYLNTLLATVCLIQVLGKCQKGVIPPTPNDIETLVDKTVVPFFPSCPDSKVKITCRIPKRYICGKETVYIRIHQVEDPFKIVTRPPFINLKRTRVENGQFVLFQTEYAIFMVEYSKILHFSIQCVWNNKLHIQPVKSDAIVIQAKRLGRLLKPTLNALPVSSNSRTKQFWLLPSDTQITVTCDVGLKNKDPTDYTCQLMCRTKPAFSTHVEKVNDGKLKLLLSLSASNNYRKVCKCTIRSKTCKKEVKRTEVMIRLPDDNVTLPAFTKDTFQDEHSERRDMMIGFSIGILLMAVLSFLIGYKVGSKMMRKKVKKKNITQEPVILLKPAPAYEDLPEREPLQEAYNLNNEGVKNVTENPYTEYNVIGDNYYDDAHHSVDNDYEMTGKLN